MLAATGLIANKSMLNMFWFHTKVKETKSLLASNGFYPNICDKMQNWNIQIVLLHKMIVKIYKEYLHHIIIQFLNFFINLSTKKWFLL